MPNNPCGHPSLRKLSGMCSSCAHELEHSVESAEAEVKRLREAIAAVFTLDPPTYAILLRADPQAAENILREALHAGPSQEGERV